MKVLVTGANGFVGARVICELKTRGHNALALVRNNDDKLAEETQKIRGDLEDGRLLEDLATRDFDAVIHAAWVANGDYLNSGQNLDHLSASLRLVRTLLKGRKRPLRFLGVGTCYEYDLQSGAQSLAEDAPRVPAHLYSKSKNALFEVLNAHASNDPLLSFAWARLFFQYGPGENDKRVVASVIRSLLMGEVAKTSEGRQRRDFLHIDDVARALVLVLESDARGAINIGSGNAPQIREIVEEIARQIGPQSRVDYGAFAPRPGDPQCVCANVEKLTNSTGFVPDFTLRDGISNAIADVRSRLS